MATEAGSLREALESLHFLYDDVPGFPVCDHDEQTWPCDTARLLAAHPAPGLETVTDYIAAHMADSWMVDYVDCADVATVLAPAVLGLINGSTAVPSPGN